MKHHDTELSRRSNSITERTYSEETEFPDFPRPGILSHSPVVDPHLELAEDVDALVFQVCSRQGIVGAIPKMSTQKAFNQHKQNVLWRTRCKKIGGDWCYLKRFRERRKTVLRVVRNPFGNASIPVKYPASRIWNKFGPRWVFRLCFITSHTHRNGKGAEQQLPNPRPGCHWRGRTKLRQLRKKGKTLPGS